MRQRERLAIGERKYIYSQLNDEALWLEAGILFGMAMQRAVERQLKDSDRRVDESLSAVQLAVDHLLEFRREAEPRSDALLGTKELRAKLGVSASTLHRWRAERDFPNPLKLGSRLRWRPDDVEEWLRGRPRK